MADNRQLPATGTGTADIIVATDDIGGVNYQRIKLSLGADGTAADAPVGGGTEAGVLRVTVASDSTGVLSVDDNGGALTVDGTVAISTNSELGIVTESAPGTDTASSGLNGRLQRIAQRLTSLIALLPTALVNGALQVYPLGAPTNVASQVTVTNTSTSIVAARATRRAVALVNNQTVAVYIDPTGGTATTSMFRLDPGASVTLLVVTAVTGITSAAYTASGDAKVHLLDLF